MLASNRYAWMFFGNGALGVRMFFVISGFLITTLLLGELDRFGSIGLRAFYKRRMLRIFPAFYLYIAVIAALSATNIVSISATDLTFAGTFTWNYSHLFFPTSPDGVLLGHFWTLALEEQFYILWPLTLALFGRPKGLKIAVTIAASMPFVRTATYFAWPASRPFTSMMLHTAADPLMFGCAAALLAGKPWFEQKIEKLKRVGWVPVGAAIFALLVSPFIRARLKGIYDLPAGMTLECVCLTIILLYVTRVPSCRAGRILNAPIPIAIGTLSYSIYLWNWLFLSPINKTWTAVFPTGICLCFLAGWLSYRFVETPFLNLRHRFNPSLEPKPATASAIARSEGSPQITLPR